MTLLLVSDPSQQEDNLVPAAGDSLEEGEKQDGGESVAESSGVTHTSKEESVVAPCSEQ